MLPVIANVLTQAEATAMSDLVDDLTFVDGRAMAGHKPRRANRTRKPLLHRNGMPTKMVHLKSKTQQAPAIFV
ncbi:MAG: hypothetical protein ACI86S_002259 [Paracoccaceae bacterium]|jgi:hypothetical protein